MTSGENYQPQIGLWAVLLLSIFAWAPATYPGYWESLEGFLPIFNISSNSAIADIGVVPDLWRGAGSGTYLLVRPLVQLGLSATTAIRFNFALVVILSGLGTYSWLRPLLGDRSASLAALIYMFMPPLLATIYIRGSLSDALAMALFPVIMSGVQTYARERSPSAIGVIVLSQIWLWRVQPGLALFIVTFAILYVLIVEWPLLVNREPWLLLAVVVSSAAGIVSLVPLWSIRAEPTVNFAEHFVYFFQLFGTEWQIAPSIPGWQDAYPFQLGFAIFVLVPFALWSWWQLGKQREPFRRFVGFMLTSAIVLIFLSLNIAKPLWQLTGVSQLLTYPWQLLLIAGLPLSALAGSLVAFNAGLRNRTYWAALILLVTLSSYPFFTTQFTEFHPNERPAAIFGANQDVLVLNADVTLSEDERQARLDIAWQALRPMDFDYNIFFQALAADNGESTVVAQVDAQPLQGARPATTWAVGEIITDAYQLELPADTAPDDLQFVFGYYNWESGARLPAKDGISGLEDDKLVIYGR